MLITQKQIEWLAAANNYGSDWRGYVDDHELARCKTCSMYGIFGEEIFVEADGTQFCDEHFPTEYTTIQKST